MIKLTAWAARPRLEQQGYGWLDITLQSAARHTWEWFEEHLQVETESTVGLSIQGRGLLLFRHLYSGTYVDCICYISTH